jgi:hypothetical protein
LNDWKNSLTRRLSLSLFPKLTESNTPSPANIESFAQIASLLTMAPFVGTPPDSSVDINMKSLALEKARPEATLDFYGTVLRDHQKLKQTIARAGRCLLMATLSHPSSLSVSLGMPPTSDGSQTKIETDMNQMARKGCAQPRPKRH